MNRNNRYFIKEGYRHGTRGDYYEDSPQQDTIWQPDVYHLADFLGERFGCTNLIDIGCGTGQKLVELFPKYRLIGVDYGGNIKYCKEHFAFGQWIEWDLEDAGRIPFGRDVLRNSLVICADVIEHLQNPQMLLDNLLYIAEHAQAVVISTPERDLIRGVTDFGPPKNPCHIREWNLEEMRQYLTSLGFNVHFSGLTVRNSVSLERKTSLLIAGNKVDTFSSSVPNDFRIVALMSASNEDDIIECSISNLIEQGIEVYLIHSGLSGNTLDRAKRFLGHGLIAIENFPATATPQNHGSTCVLRRKEELANSIAASWFIHQNADEIVESPWPSMPLKDAIYNVDRWGFNAIDHTIINFRRRSNLTVTCRSLAQDCHFFDFGNKTTDDLLHMRAWKYPSASTSLMESGGRRVNFTGRHVFPYNFLLRRYPAQSEHDAIKSVLKEHPVEEESVNGWSSDLYCARLKHDSMRIAENTFKYFDSNFYDYYLVERLSGIGIKRSSLQ